MDVLCLRNKEKEKKEIKKFLLTLGCRTNLSAIIPFSFFLYFLNFFFLYGCAWLCCPERAFLL